MTPVRLTAERLQRVPLIGLAVGLVAAGGLAAGAFLGTEPVLRAYLTAYLFWWQIAIGCLGLTMLNHLVGGRWGYATRPIMTAATMTFPLLAILFTPIAFGLSELFIWADAEVVAADKLLQHKAPYLDPQFFRLRAFGYFAVWITFGLIYCRPQLLKILPSGKPRSAASGQSGLGLVLLAMTASFAAMDWGMSLEPHWYSTIYGALMAVGGGLMALALSAGILSLGVNGPADDEDNLQVLQDLGSLLLAFVMLWAYFAFSQFLIIWSGNLPDEIRWYLRRLDGGWQWLAILIVLFHFFLPFLLLIDRGRKRHPTSMLVIGLLLLVVHYLDVFWTIRPAFGDGRFSLHWADVVAPVAVGGLWISVFAWQLARRLALVEPARSSAEEGG